MQMMVCTPGLVNALIQISCRSLSLVGLTALQVFQQHAPSNDPATTTSPETIILILGASGGTGHVALQVAKALGFSDITPVCSQSNADFCRDCGATQVVSYDTTDNLLESLLQTILTDGQGHEEQDGYYSVVLDCVTSADPPDSKPQYPHLIQHGDHAHRLLTKDYVYRRLGGPTKDWFRAGMERTMGWGGWFLSHEKLFWIRFPKSSHEFEQLKGWVERGRSRFK
jgi:hypothetical protein